MPALPVPPRPRAPRRAPARTAFAPRILVVPTDFSASAERALPVALALAERTGAEVHLVHTLRAVAGDVSEWREQQARARLNAPRMLYRHSLSGRAAIQLAVLRPMGPGEAIVAYARQVGADLVVMAAHGWKAPCEDAVPEGPADPLAAGAVSANTARVLREAPCAVLVVPPAPTPTSPFRHVIALGRAPGLRTLAAAVAAALGADLAAHDLAGLDATTPLPYGPPDLWVVPDAATACLAFRRTFGGVPGCPAAVIVPAPR